MRLPLILAGMLLATPMVHAQAPAPAIPDTMPFDIPYGTPIPLDQAHKAITGAAAEAKKRNWKMAISYQQP